MLEIPVKRHIFVEDQTHPLVLACYDISIENDTFKSVTIFDNSENTIINNTVKETSTILDYLGDMKLSESKSIEEYLRLMHKYEGMDTPHMTQSFCQKEWRDQLSDEENADWVNEMKKLIVKKLYPDILKFDIMNTFIEKLAHQTYLPRYQDMITNSSKPWIWIQFDRMEVNADKQSQQTNYLYGLFEKMFDHYVHIMLPFLRNSKYSKRNNVDMCVDLDLYSNESLQRAFKGNDFWWKWLQCEKQFRFEKVLDIIEQHLDKMYEYQRMLYLYIQGRIVVKYYLNSQRDQKATIKQLIFISEDRLPSNCTDFVQQLRRIVYPKPGINISRIPILSDTTWLRHIWELIMETPGLDFVKNLKKLMFRYMMMTQEMKLVNKMSVDDKMKKLLPFC